MVDEKFFENQQVQKNPLADQLFAGDRAKQSQDMKKVLSNFYAAAKKVTTNVVRESRQDPMLAEALNTRSIPGGVQVGEWQVIQTTNESGKARYTVKHSGTNAIVANDLHLFECAQAMVRMLNKNYSPHSPQMAELMRLEEKYVKHVRDANVFKRKASNGQRDAIAESRFEEAKRNAISVKDEIKRINLMIM